MVKLTNSRLAILRAAKADGVYIAGLRERKAVDALDDGGLVTCCWRRHKHPDSLHATMIAEVRITAKGRAALKRWQANG